MTYIHVLFMQMAECVGGKATTVVRGCDSCVSPYYEWILDWYIIAPPFLAYSLTLMEIPDQDCFQMCMFDLNHVP